MKSGLVVYRAIMGVDEEKRALIFAGHVEEKSKVRISDPRGRIKDLFKLLLGGIGPLKPFIGIG